MEAIMNNAQGDEQPLEVIDNQNGSYTIKYKVISKTDHFLDVTVREQPIKGSPFVINVSTGIILFFIHYFDFLLLMIYISAIIIYYSEIYLSIRKRSIVCYIIETGVNLSKEYYAFYKMLFILTGKYLKNFEFLFSL